MTEELKNIINALEKIEFYEFKNPSYIKSGIATRFYIKPNSISLHDFLKLCDGENWNHNYTEEEFQMKYKKAMSSKRDNPHFQMFINNMHCEIYPKQSYIEVTEVGLHYICQHSFDIFPYEVKDLFYGYERFAKPIGKLYPIKRCKLENCGQHDNSLVVKNSDILSGFMLDREGIDKYDDSFIEWIKHRRFIEVK
jgi:hypothetical protein